MELEVTTLYDLFLEKGESEEDSSFDQFTLVEIFGIYLIIHTYESGNKMDQELIAYDELEQAEDWLKKEGIKVPVL